MRKLMMAVMAVAGLGVAAGCKSEVKEERQDVAEARQGVQQEQREMQQEIAGERQEGQQELAEQRQDVQEERQELTEAQREQMREQQEEGIGGGAMAGSQQVDGRIQSASPDAVVLIIPDQNNKQMRFKADRQTQVMRDNKTVSLSELKPGDEVRANYEMGQAGNLILRSIEVEKQNQGMQNQGMQNQGMQNQDMQNQGMQNQGTQKNK